MNAEGLILIASVSVGIGILLARKAGEKLRLPVATLAIALVTLVVGVLVLFDPVLLAALRRTDGFFAGEWWRIITPLFAQDGGWFGLVFNLVTLVVVGALFESAFGWRMLLVTYFAAGLLSEVAAYTVLPGQGFAGNSVANFGLAGMLAVVALTLEVPARALGVISLAGGVFLLAHGLFIFDPPDLHAVGYFTGAAIGLIYLFVRRARTRPRPEPAPAESVAP